MLRRNAGHLVQMSHDNNARVSLIKGNMTDVRKSQWLWRSRTYSPLLDSIGGYVTSTLPRLVLSRYRGQHIEVLVLMQRTVYDRWVVYSLDRMGKLVAIAVFVALIVDGMDLQMLALSLPNISKELGLSSIDAGALSTYTLLGMGIGGVLAGWLSDRIGRVRVVWWSVLTFSAFTGVIALCHTYLQIAAMRFISGFGLGALYSIGTLLAAEYVPARVRTTVLGTLQAGWSVGYVCAALLSAYLLPVYGWRALFICAIVPGIVALVLLWNVPDPPSWAATYEHTRDSVRPFAAIWADPPLRRTFLLWTVAAFALQFGYYGANSWLPSYLMKDLGVDAQSTGWYVAGTYTMMVSGKVITGWLADRVGRRVLWIVSGLLTAVYLPFVVYAATPQNVVYLLLVFGFVYGAPYAVNSTYLSESFPRGVRGTGVAGSYNIGRVGSTLSPLLIGLTASSYSIGLGISLLGISYAVCALVPGLFIREKMFDPSVVEPPVIHDTPLESLNAILDV
jgi:MFS transporter, AAHS family, cis,cis-muconate transporter